MSLPLSLPTIQNWSCHSCGACCRDDQVVVVTPEERQRILDQNWTAADGVPDIDHAFVPTGRGAGAGWRLNHQPSGACVFLDENNRCRIHARFGEAAKPLPCRLYPFVFTPAGKSVAVSLRFACPSAATNTGLPLERQRNELLVLRDLAMPPAAGKGSPPAIGGEAPLSWPDTLRIVGRLRHMLETEKAPLALQLVHASWVAGMLRQATFEKVLGPRLNELLEALAFAAPLETVESLDDLDPPARLVMAQFRLIVAQYAGRHSQHARRLSRRLGRALAGLRFVLGLGRAPSMQPGLARVPFAAIERVTGGSSPEIDALLRRYLVVKLDGMAFCGPGFGDLGVADGFQGLVVVYAVVLYIARWLAAADGRATVSVEDAQRALSIVDYHHGYSAATAGGSARRRIALLTRHNQIGRLLAWLAP